MMQRCPAQAACPPKARLSRDPARAARAPAVAPYVPVRPAPLPVVLACVLSATFAAAPDRVAAEDLFPGPGYWIYPDRPALDAEELARLCRAGMSVLFADLGRISIIADYYLEALGAEAPRTMVDSVSWCTRDEDAAREYCEGHVWEADGSQVLQTLDMHYDRAGDGNLRSTVLVAETSHTSVSYPQRCPDDMVRELIFAGMPPPE